MRLRIIYYFFGFLYLISPQFAFSLHLPEVTNTPARNEFCIKRKEYLKEIERQFLGKESIKVLVLIGMAGIGKTQLANAYAHTYSQDYKVVWWMDGKQDLLPQFRELGLSMSAKKGCPMPDLGERTLQNWIKPVHECSVKYFPTVLLVIDDVKNKELILPIIQGLKNAHILLTSRDKSVEDNAMCLKGFTREESVAYLQQTLPRSDPVLLDKLAEALHDYPLALTQASSYIRSYPSVSLEEYIKLYHEKRKLLWKEEEKLTAGSPEELLRDYQHTVASTFTLQLDEIKKTSPHAVDILKLTCFLGNQDIPKHFLKAWSVDHLKMNELEFHDALSSLIKHSIFEINKNDNYKDDIYSIHASLHEYIRDNLSKDETNHYLKEAANLISSFLPESSYQSWKALFDDRYLEFHLESLMKMSERLNYQIDELLKLKIKYLSYIHFYKSDYQTAAPRVDELEVAICSNNNISLLEKGKFLTLLGNIATIKRSYDEAITISEKAENILSDIDSPIAKEELFLLLVNNLMDFYNTKGNIKKGEEAGKKAQQLLPYITQPTYQALYYLMRSWQLYNKGAYIDACKHLDTAIKIPSKDFPDHFHIFNKIIKSEILARSGDLENAYELLESNYKIFKEKYPNESNFKVLRMDMTRAFIYLKQKKLAESFEIINATIEGLDKLFSERIENSMQGFSHIILGEIYERKNDLVKALDEYRKAEAIYNQIYKTIEVDDYSYLYKNLILLSAKMKDDLTTKKYLHLFIDNFGLDHPRILELMNTLDDQDLNIL